MITVGDVLAMPVFESVRLAAPCDRCLSRRVVNAGILDFEPFEGGYEDFFPNEFVFSSLGFARRDPALAEEAILAMIERDVAALAIKPVALNEISPRVAASSARRGVPVFFYEGQYYERILTSILSLIRSDEEQSSKGRQIDRLLAERPPADTRAALYDVARATGATLQCVAVAPRKGDDLSLYAVLTALSAELVEFRRDWGSVETAYACRYRDRLLAFVSYSRPPIDGRSRSEPDLIARIEAMAPVLCGVSEEVPLADGDLAVRQALAALDRACGGSRSTVRWADLGRQAFRVAAEGDRLFSRTCALFRRELEAYDAANDARMSATAEAFARSCGDVRGAADLLFQHPNTVRYRLPKVKELVGMPDATDRELAQFLALVFIAS